MNKYWWIVRTDTKCGLPYDTFIRWFNLPSLIYCIARYRSKNVNFWFCFSWVDMDSPIGEHSYWVKYIQRRKNNVRSNN